MASRVSPEGRGAKLKAPQAAEFRDSSEGSLERAGGGAHEAREAPAAEGHGEAQHDLSS